MTLRERLGRVRWRRVVLIGGAGSFLAAGAFVGIGYAVTDVPEPSDVATAQATIIRYADGQELGRVGAQNRINVELSDVPEHVQKAVLAAEDRGFYEHAGISPRGIARALFANVRGGGVSQGGSTITQQYAKNAFLTQERTFTRKVKEVFIALKMAQTLPKDEVLERYLNTIYFGRGSYGIEVASRTYFGKSTDKLSVAEGAVLAASIRAPALYDPERHPERAAERYRYVLRGMVEQGWLEEAEAQQLGGKYPENVRKIGQGGRTNDLSGPKGHVITQVMEELQRRGFGEDRLAAGGLVVQTSIRKQAQDAAVAAVEAALKEANSPQQLHGALVAVKPGTGEVFAYYGGATGTGFDYAGQGGGRQPGSSFKPYVLAAALEEGMSLRTRLDGNSPKDFPGRDKPVSNFGGADYGRVDLVEATAKSVNTAYYELALEVGPSQVRSLAHRAGISEDRPLANADGFTGGGIGLGEYEVRVIDQAVGFATFANKGVATAPLFVKTVRTTDGEVVYEAEVRKRKAFDADVAADATYAMQQVVERGTGTRARLDGRPAAGKTGTTQNNWDVWFSGYTPNLAAAVWMGTGRNETIQLPGGQATGGRLSAALWKDFMDAALEGQEVLRFPPRANVGNDRDVRDDRRTRRPEPTATSAPTSAPPTQAPPTQPPQTQSPPPQPTRPPVTQEPPPTQSPPPASQPPPTQPAGSAAPQPSG